MLKIEVSHLMLPLAKTTRKIITVIGSTRFFDDINKWAWEKTKQGFLILFTPFRKELNPECEIYRKELEIQHFQKIRMADIVFVFNKDGYIGEHTKMELEYAQIINKPIKYLNDI